MDEKLKACPFCGSEHIDSDKDDDARAFGDCWKIQCDECGAEMHADTRDVAIERWNRRVQGA